MLVTVASVFMEKICGSTVKLILVNFLSKEQLWKVEMCGGRWNSFKCKQCIRWISQTAVQGQGLWFFKFRWPTAIEPTQRRHHILWFKSWTSQNKATHSMGIHRNDRTWIGRGSAKRIDLAVQICELFLSWFMSRRRRLWKNYFISNLNVCVLRSEIGEFICKVYHINRRVVGAA